MCESFSTGAGKGEGKRAKRGKPIGDLSIERESRHSIDNRRYYLMSRGTDLRTRVFPFEIGTYVMKRATFLRGFQLPG